MQVVINLNRRVDASPSSSRSDEMTLGRPFKAGNTLRLIDERRVSDA